MHRRSMSSSHHGYSAFPFLRTRNFNSRMTFLILGMCMAYSIRSLCWWTRNIEEYGPVSSYTRVEKLFSCKSQIRSFYVEPFRYQHEKSFGCVWRSMLQFNQRCGSNKVIYLCMSFWYPESSMILLWGAIFTPFYHWLSGTYYRMYKAMGVGEPELTIWGWHVVVAHLFLSWIYRCAYFRVSLILDWAQDIFYL